MGPEIEQTRRIGALDGVRVVAILGVVCLHLLLIANIGVTTSKGASGAIFWGLLGNVIDLFFIISGFLIFLPMVRRGTAGSIMEYALDRVSRIVPGYWLCLAVVALLAVVAPIATSVSPSARDLLVHGFALQMPARLMDPGLVIGFGIDGPLWMISVIVGFYVVLPLIAERYIRHPIMGLAIAAVIAFAWRAASSHLPGLFSWVSSGSQPDFIVSLIATDQLPGWSFSFALGMTGAWAYSTCSRARMRRIVINPWFIFLSVFAYIGFSYVYGRQAAGLGGPSAGSFAREDPLLMLSSSASRAALIAILVLGPEWLQRPFAHGAFTRLSELSYGVYLSHIVVAVYLVDVFGVPQSGSLATVAILFAVVLPTSLFYATVSLAFVERPTMVRIRTLAKARGSAPPPIGRHASGAP